MPELMTPAPATMTPRAAATHRAMAAEWDALATLLATLPGCDTAADDARDAAQDSKRRADLASAEPARHDLRA